MDDFKHLCPVCKNKGVTNFLQLRQIDLNNAVYLCKDIRCIYPQGHSWIYVERSLSSDNEDSDCDSDVNDDIEAMGILMLQKTGQKKQKPTQQNVNDDSLAPNLNLGDIKEGSNQTNIGMFETSWSHDVKNMINIEIVHPTVTVENKEEVSKEVTNQKNNEILEESWNQDLKNMLSLEIIDPIVTVENKEQVDETTENKTKNNENIENEFKNNEKEIKNYKLSTKPIEEPHLFNSQNATDFHAVFNTRLRLKTKGKKDNDSFKIPDNIIQQALQNIQTVKEEKKPKKKKNIVNDIMGEKRNLPNLTNSAASFEGFKFSSKTIKPPNPDAESKIRPKSNRNKNLHEGKVLDFSPNCSKDKLETEENIIKDDTTLSLLNDDESPKIPSILSKSSKNRTKNLHEGKVLDFSPIVAKPKTDENIIKDDTTLSLLNDDESSKNQSTLSKSSKNRTKNVHEGKVLDFSPIVAKPKTEENIIKDDTTLSLSNDDESQKNSSTLTKSSKNRTKNLHEGKLLDFSPIVAKLETEENIIKEDTTLSLLNDLIDTMDDGTDKDTSYKMDDPEFESWLETYITT